MSATKTAVATTSRDEKSRRTKTDKAPRKGTKTKGKKTKKVDKVTLPRNRINLNQGIYINPSRCKHWMDAQGLNREIEYAITQLRLAEPHDIEKDGVVVKTTKKVELTALPEDVQRIVEQGRVEWEEREKQRIKKEHVDAERAKNSSEAADKLKQRAERQQRANDERAQRAKERADKGEAPQVKKVTPYSREIELLSKMRIRFSKDSSFRTAATICHAMHELMEYGMEVALRQNRRIVKQNHVLEPGYENLSLSCLYTKLSVFKEALAAERQQAIQAREDKERREREKQAAKAKSKEDDSKEVTDTVVAVDVADTKTVKEEPDAKDDEESGDESGDEDDEDEDEGVLDFKHYIRQVCFNIIEQRKVSNPEYDSIRISQQIKDFGSNLVIAFIQDLCPLLQGEIAIMKVRTISPTVVKHVIDFHLMINGVDTKNVDATIADKIVKYNAFAKERKKRNAEKKKLVADKSDKKVPDKDVDDVVDKVAELKVESAPKRRGKH